MNTDKSLEIIDALAAKLGVAAEHLIQEFARYEVAGAIAGLLTLLALWVGFALGLRYWRSKVRVDPQGDATLGIGFALSVCAMILFVATGGIVPDCIATLASPRAAAVKAAILEALWGPNPLGATTGGCHAKARSRPETHWR